MKKTLSERIIVGITGASGALYGVRSLQLLKEKGFETHLIISEAGRKVIELETDYKVRDVEALASRTYDDGDLAAPVASGWADSWLQSSDSCVMSVFSAMGVKLFNIVNNVPLYVP